MANCNFDWSVCQVCASQGSNLCPLENNRTIKEIKRKLRELEEELAREKNN